MNIFFLNVYFSSDLIAFNKSWFDNIYLYISAVGKVAFKRVFNSADTSSVASQFLLSFTKYFIYENTDST